MLELGRCILDVLQILDARREAECQVPHAQVVAVLADVQRELPPATSCTTQRSGQDGTKRRARTLLLTCRQRSRLQAPLVSCPQMLSLTQMDSCYFLDARNAGRIGTSMPVASLLRFPRMTKAGVFTTSRQSSLHCGSSKIVAAHALAGSSPYTLSRELVAFRRYAGRLKVTINTAATTPK